MDDILKLVTIINVLLSGGYIGWRVFKRDERKAQIEYFERKAKDLEIRYQGLESRYFRLESFRSFVFSSLGDSHPIVRVGKDIIDGKVSYGINDPTEEH